MKREGKAFQRRECEKALRPGRAGEEERGERGRAWGLGGTLLVPPRRSSPGGDPSRGRQQVEAGSSVRR